MKTFLVLLLFPFVALAQDYRTPPYSASDFRTLGIQAWTVPSATINPTQFRYSLTPLSGGKKRLEMFFQLEGTTLAGPPSNELGMRLPEGVAPTGWYSAPVCMAWFVDPVTTSWRVEAVYATTGRGNPFIGFPKWTGALWSVWSGNPVVNLYCSPIIMEVE